MNRPLAKPVPKQGRYIPSNPLPPTPGLYKLGPAAQEAALSRAKAFYPFT